MRIDRELAAAALDAQCRDWVADRPDRVGFARLGQARHEVFTATRRYRAIRVPAEWLLMTTIALVVVAVFGSDDPLRLAGAAVAGLWTALAARATWHHLRRRRARAAASGPAPIADLYRYADLRHRIEACALAARNDRSRRRRPAATDLEYALDWLAAAQDELPGRL